MVHHFDLELSMIRAYSVEGSPLDIEPSMISTSSGMVHHFDLELSTIRAYSVDGSLLRHEPSMISTYSVDGSPF